MRSVLRVAAFVAFVAGAAGQAGAQVRIHDERAAVTALHFASGACGEADRVAVAGFRRTDLALSPRDQDSVRNAMISALESHWPRFQAVGPGDVEQVRDILSETGPGRPNLPRLPGINMVMSFEDTDRVDDATVSFRIVVFAADGRRCTTGQLIRAAIPPLPPLRDLGQMLSGVLTQLRSRPAAERDFVLCDVQPFGGGRHACNAPLTEAIRRALAGLNAAPGGVFDGRTVRVIPGSADICARARHPNRITARFGRDPRARAMTFAIVASDQFGAQPNADVQSVTGLPADCDPTLPIQAALYRELLDRPAVPALTIRAARAAFEVGDAVDIRLSARAALSLFCVSIGSDGRGYAILPAPGGASRARTARAGAFVYPDDFAGPATFRAPDSNVFGCVGVPSPVPAAVTRAWEEAWCLTPERTPFPRSLAEADLRMLLDGVRRLQGAVESYTETVVQGQAAIPLGFTCEGG